MIAAAIAFFLTIALVPVVRAVCIRWRLLDTPGPVKIHLQPVPRLGGVALSLAISAAAFFSHPRQALSAWPFFAGLGLVWVTGFADDLRSMSPVIRVSAQFFAGALLWRHGWRIPALGSGTLDLLATAAFVAVLANSVNLLDGMDGLAAGVVGIIAAAFVALPAALGNAFASAVAFALAGACIGFLLFNRPIAKIFLGDGGSTPLGYTIAFLGLDLYRARPVTLPLLLFPLLVAALPLLDAALALFRRLRSRSSPLQGDRRHVYDLLRAQGSPVHRILFAAYGVTGLLAVVASWGVRKESLLLWFVAAAIVGMMTLGAIRIGALRSVDPISAAQLARAPKMENNCGESSSTG